jgi:hypothetical protein
MRSSHIALAVAMMLSAALILVRPSSLRSSVEAVGVAAPVAAQGTVPARGGGSPEEGFTDTPMVPGQSYHVHDPARPRPVVITPGTQVGQPPSDAVVLFDGKDLSKWSAVQFGTASFTQSATAAPWKVENGYFEVVPGSGGIATREQFGDVQVHVEWAAPASRRGNSQNRGNSGLFFMGLYEVQILDNYENPTYADGTAGAIYGQWPPLVNALRPAGEWQSYDVVFEAPRFQGGALVKPAFITVFVNGVVVHNRKASMGPMVYRDVAKYVAHPAQGPIGLQDHDHPVRYRNIWARRLGGYDGKPLE